MFEDEKDQSSGSTTRLMQLFALGLNPLSGGDDPPEPPANPEPPAPDGEPSDPGPDQNVPWNKDKRFQEFTKSYKDFKRYRELGTPDELAEVKQSSAALSEQLQAIDARIAQLNAKREPGESKSKEQVTLEEARKLARQELRGIEPGIERGENAADFVDGMRSALEEEALDTTVELMKSAEMALDKSSLKNMSEIIADEIKGDPKLYRKFFRDPDAAVRGAWTKMVDKFAGVAKREAAAKVEKDKKTMSNLPKPHGSGGTPSRNDDGPAKTLKDLEARLNKRVLA